jgi:hypothetical protein
MEEEEEEEEVYGEQIEKIRGIEGKAKKKKSLAWKGIMHKNYLCV